MPSVTILPPKKRGTSVTVIPRKPKGTSVTVIPKKPSVVSTPAQEVVPASTNPAQNVPDAFGMTAEGERIDASNQQVQQLAQNQNLDTAIGGVVMSKNRGLLTSQDAKKKTADNLAKLDVASNLRLDDFVAFDGLSQQQN